MSGNDGVKLNIFLAPKNKTITLERDSELKIEELIAQLCSSTFEDSKRNPTEAGDFHLFVINKFKKSLTMLDNSSKLKDILSILNSETHLVFKKAITTLPSNTVEADGTSVATNPHSTPTEGKQRPFVQIQMGTDSEMSGENKNIEWLICSVCGHVIGIDKIENHVRFCSYKGKKLNGVGVYEQQAKNEDTLVAQALRSLDSLIHILLCSVGAWLFGYMGMDFFWIICLFFIIYKLDGRAKKKGFKQKSQKFEQSLRQFKDPERPGLETLEWLNLLMDKFWPSISPRIDDSLKTLLLDTLNHESIKPSSIDKFIIDNLVFGNIPPHFRHVIAIDTPNGLPTHFKFHVDALYMPRAEMTLTAVIGLVKFPIKFEDIYIRGRMHLTVEFIQDYPYIDYLEVGFIKNPKLDLSIQVGRLINIMDISFLHDWLKNLITELIAGFMVPPAKLQFSIKDIMVPSDTTVQVEQSEIPQGSNNPVEDTILYIKNLEDRYFHPDLNHSTISTLIHRYLSEKRAVDHQRRKLYREENKTMAMPILKRRPFKKRPEEEMITNNQDLKKLMEIQKKKTRSFKTMEGEVIGILTVKLISGYDLVAERRLVTSLMSYGFVPRPYVILRVGHTFFKTEHSQFTKDPVWNQTFKFQVMSGDEKKLDIQLNTHRNMYTHDFLGREVVDFSELKEGEPAKMWIPISISKGNIGQVHLLMTFKSH